MRLRNVTEEKVRAVHHELRVAAAEANDDWFQPTLNMAADYLRSVWLDFQEYKEAHPE